MNKYLFLLVFDAVDIFQSNIGTVTWKEKFFLQDQTNTMAWIMNKYLFLLAFDAVDIFQSNIGTLPQLQMFFEL